MIIIAPIILPLIMIFILLFIKSVQWQKIIAIGGSLLLMVCSIMLLYTVHQSGILVMQAGGWDAPFGITLIVDLFSGLMLLTASIIALSLAIFSSRMIPDELISHRFFVFFFSLLMGVNGAFLTGDVFNLYVWFEVMLMSSFVLITLGSQKLQLEGGIKYLSMNLVSSLFFLAGIGLLYAKTGTLNMAHLASILAEDNESLLMNTSAMLFFIAFAIKAAVFPFFFWLPSSYHTPPLAITALFAGLLTKVGVYAFIRFFTLFFIQDQAFWHQLLLIIAGFTMVVGGITAAAHYESRKILSFHIISQIGYMIMGLGIYTPLALAGAIYFTLHNMFAKTNAFLAMGLVDKLQGSFHLKAVGGLYKSSPILALLFIIPAFALAGIPPLTGFFGKYMLVKAGIESHQYLITGVALLTGILTLFSMIKIWNEAFLKKKPETEVNEERIKTQKLSSRDYVPLLILATSTLVMGFGAEAVIKFIVAASNQLLNSNEYINAVLNANVL